MKIALFGATGRIGQIVLRRALEQNYEVTAYARREIALTHENLTVIHGELSEEEKIRQAIRGVDAVICVLGEFRQLDVIPPAHERILRIMQEEGVSRFINLMTPASITHEKDKFCFTTAFPKVMVRILDPKESLIGSQSVAQMVAKSPLKWTIVRCVWPVDGPYTGQVNAGYGKPLGEKNMKRIKVKLSREDIAQFLLDQVKSKRYICDMPIIGGF